MKVDHIHRTNSTRWLPRLGRRLSILAGILALLIGSPTIGRKMLAQAPSSQTDANASKTLKADAQTQQPTTNATGVAEAKAELARESAATASEDQNSSSGDDDANGVANDQSSGSDQSAGSDQRAGPEENTSKAAGSKTPASGANDTAAADSQTSSSGENGAGSQAPGLGEAARGAPQAASQVKIAASSEESKPANNTPVSPPVPKSELAQDTANLMKLASSLKADVDKTTKDTLSVTVVREAGEIEQLAHKMRTK